MDLPLRRDASLYLSFLTAVMKHRPIHVAWTPQGHLWETQGTPALQMGRPGVMHLVLLGMASIPLLLLLNSAWHPLERRTMLPLWLLA